MALCVIYLQSRTDTYLVGGRPLWMVAESDLEEGGDRESKLKKCIRRYTQSIYRATQRYRSIKHVCIPGRGAASPGRC